MYRACMASVLIRLSNYMASKACAGLIWSHCLYDFQKCAYGLTEGCEFMSTKSFKLPVFAKKTPNSISISTKHQSHNKNSDIIPGVLAPHTPTSKLRRLVLECPRACEKNTQLCTQGPVRHQHWKGGKGGGTHTSPMKSVRCVVAVTEGFTYLFKLGVFPEKILLMLVFLFGFQTVWDLFAAKKKL